MPDTTPHMSIFQLGKGIRCEAKYQGIYYAKYYGNVERGYYGHWEKKGKMKKGRKEEVENCIKMG